MQGEPIEFEFVSSDASTAAPIVLRTAGSRTSRTLESTERVIVTNINAVIGAITVNLIADSDADGDVDDGDRMAVLGEGAHSPDFGCAGICGAMGILPKVIASGAGAISITGVGVIVRA